MDDRRFKFLMKHSPSFQKMQREFEQQQKRPQDQANRETVELMTREIKEHAEKQGNSKMTTEQAHQVAASIAEKAEHKLKIANKK